MIVPPRARGAWLAQHGQPVGDWIDRLPGLATDLMRRWACTVAGPLRAGVGGAILPVRRGDGTRAVLKMSGPHEAADVESTVLATWAGRGAVLLLERDDEHHAPLLEQLADSSLADVPDADESMAVVGRLASVLAVPAPPGLPRLSEAWAR